MTTLAVPLISQLGRAASRYVADCGIACVAMCLAWAGKDVPTVDQLAAKTTLAQLDRGLDPVAISDLLRQHGVNCRVNGGTQVDDIRREIDAGKPVIVPLLWQGRRHAMLAVGWDTTGFTVNDPATVALHITYAQVNTGMVNLQLGRQCVFITDPPPMPLAGAAVTTGVVNVRSGPNGAVIGQLSPDTAVLVLETEGEWSAVTLTAYVATKHLKKA